MEIIDGRKIADKIKEEIKEKLDKIEGRKPGLAIILVGNRSDSEIYVGLKQEAAREVGIETHLYRFDWEVSQQEVVETISHLNSDREIDAILVQFPLPDNFDSRLIMGKLDPSKDVDGFQPQNLEILMSACQDEKVVPPVFRAVLRFCREVDYRLDGKRAVIISNSDIFGKSLEKVLQCKGARAEKIGPDQIGLEKKIAKADIVISAVGRPEFIKGENFKDGAIAIDVGITKEGKKVYGDVDFISTKEKKGFITPVPGGVGPVTVAMLLENTLQLYEKTKLER